MPFACRTCDPDIYSQPKTEEYVNVPHTKTQLAFIAFEKTLGLSGQPSTVDQKTICLAAIVICWKKSSTLFLEKSFAKVGKAATE